MAPEDDSDLAPERVREAALAVLALGDALERGELGEAGRKQLSAIVRKARSRKGGIVPAGDERMVECVAELEVVYQRIKHASEAPDPDPYTREMIKDDVRDVLRRFPPSLSREDFGRGLADEATLEALSLTATQIKGHGSPLDAATWAATKAIDTGAEATTAKTRRRVRQASDHGKALAPDPQHPSLAEHAPSVGALEFALRAFDLPDERATVLASFCLGVGERYAPMNEATWAQFNVELSRLTRHYAALLDQPKLGGRGVASREALVGREDAVSQSLQQHGMSPDASDVLAHVMTALAPVVAVTHINPEGSFELLRLLAEGVRPSTTSDPAAFEAALISACMRLEIAADLAPIEWAARRAVEGLSGVAFACASDGSEDELDAEEARFIASATAARRQEYASGTVAARRALRRAGVRGVTLERDDDGVPVFPTTHVGSIAHSSGRALVCVGPRLNFSGLGVDLEHDGRDDGLSETALTPVERRSLLPALADSEDTLRSPATLAFSAKEAIYKAVYPGSRQEADLDEIELEFDREARTLWTASLPGWCGRVDVRYELAGGWIVALAVVAKDR